MRLWNNAPSADCSDPADDAAIREGRAKRIVRLAVRLTALAGMTALLTGSVRLWPWASLIVPALSPYVMIGSALGRSSAAVGLCANGPAGANAVFSLAALVGLPVLVMVLISRRWFCRYACPVGLATEPLRRLRPAARGGFARVPHVGRWIVLATMAGAVLGCPLALWLDPLAMFSGAFGLWHDPAGLAGWVAAGALAVIGMAAVLWPNVWCLRVCPLGASQELLAPGALLRSWRGQHPGADAPGSPADSVSPRDFGSPVDRVSPRDSGSPADSGVARKRRIARRRVLSLAAGTLAAAAGAGVAWWARSTAKGAAAKPLRPPGAAGESQFPWLCIRCGNCVRACPARILHPDEAPGAPLGFLTPVVRFDKTYCKEDCRLCTEVCPSGAIAPLSLAQKQSWPMGLAKVDMTWCLLSPDNGERECAICRNVCPYQAIKLDFNYETYVTTPRVDPQKCPGCGACEAACPGTNESQRAQSPDPAPLRRAIFVVPRDVRTP